MIDEEFKGFIAHVTSERNAARDYEFMRAVRAFAKENGHTEIMEIPEKKLQIILQLGCEEYARRYGNDKT